MAPGVQQYSMTSIDSRILSLIDELDALRTSRDDHWQIPRVEGELLHHIALSSGAKKIVEIGTSYGFSGLWWGAALQQTGGQLHTIDMSRKKYDSSRQTFDLAGLSGTIVNYLGDAAEVLGTIGGPIDLAFIDADKPACRAYFDLLWPKLRVGGSILTDNATTHREELAEYVAYVRSVPHASSCEVAVGNGIEWTIKRK
jgi:predicted O-methyltransferase YrrM